MKIRRLHRLSAIVVAAALALSTRARADDVHDQNLIAARELFTQATQDEADKHWAAALEKLQKVFAIKPTAGVRFHIANCEEGLGQLAKALDDYTRAATQAQSENAVDVLKIAPDKIADLRARVPWLTLVVPDDVKDTAQVKLDGAPIAPALWGTQMPVDPGDHRVEASARGRAGFSTVITLAVRNVKVLSINLAPATPPKATEVTTSPAIAPGASAPSSSARSSAQPSGIADTPRSTSAAGGGKTGAIVATVGAVVLAAGGVGAFVLAGSKHDDGVTTCSAQTGPCDDQKESVRLWDTIALGAWIGAAALGVVSVVLWTSPSTPASPTKQARIFVTPTGAGLAGSF
jgi:hypothetical protein